MSKEEYLIYRNKNSPEPLYEYYKENYKTGEFLNRENFFRFIQIWPHTNEAFNNVLREYDAKFEMMTVSDLKTGQVIKYL